MPGFGERARWPPRQGVLARIVRWRRVHARRAATMCGRALLVSVATAPIACGKKGPPMPPIVRVPAAASDFAARRIGDTVHLQLTIPSANTDGSRPADVGAVTVYGLTGVPLSNEDLLKRGTVVARFPVRKPPPPLPEGARPDVPPLPATGPGLDQGALAVAVEEVTPEITRPPVQKPARGQDAPPEPSDVVLALPLAGPPAEALLSRVYAAIGNNRHGQRGPLSPRVFVPMVGAPTPPAAPEVTYSATGVTVTWTVPPDARQHVQIPTPFPPPAPAAAPGTAPAGVAPAAAASPPTAPPSPAPAPPPTAAPASAAEPPAPAAAPAGDPGAPVPSRPVSLASSASTYNVYEVPPPDEEPSDAATGSTPQGGGAAQPSDQTAAPIPKPLNAAPLAAPTFVDPRVEFGARRCYVVRTVNTYGTMAAESGASQPTCVTLVDTFPPAAPKSLAAVASPGAISLIWEANTERDLAGYLILRAEAPNETLQPLFEAPIRETSFQDKSVRAGVEYTYAVIALDKAEPPNPSAQSNRVTETAR